jgi:hypothetical protein
MAKVRLGEATFVERGYGQVEPNHLSAQRTGQIYAQLPAAEDINLLENGQFVKYDYAKEVVDFEGKGEWMLVFNEVKVYRDGQSDCDFAMIRDNYVARIYSPIDGAADMVQMTQPRDYSNVVTPADPYEWDSTDNPFQATWDYAGPKKMPEKTKMVPRVFKTNVGDIYTTNCLMADEDPEIGATFTPNAQGYLEAGESDDMTWEVVKVYDLGDRQKAVKLMRIK